MNDSEKKIINAIIYFASVSPKQTIDRLKLMKLLWLSDRVHLIKYGRTIFEDKYYAMQCGPVLSSAKDLSSKSIISTYKVEGYFIKSISAPDLDYFSDSDVEVMELVWDNYGQMKSKDIVNYSHKFPEWKRFKNSIKKSAIARFEMYLEDFFKMPSDARFKSIVGEDIDDLIDHSLDVYRNNKAVISWLQS